MKVCSFPECERKMHGRGLCNTHLAQLKAGLQLAPIGHYQRRKKCQHCDAISIARSMCKDHYYLWHKYGSPFATPHSKRAKSPYVDSDGYVRVHVPDHPRAYKSGWYLEHRVVMESKLGRLLVDGENVHHINGNRQDNRPENLELWVSSQPAGQRVDDLLAWASEIQALYGQANP